MVPQQQQPPQAAAPAPAPAQPAAPAAPAKTEDAPAAAAPPAKRSRTNTPWTPAEEHKLKNLRDAGNSWAEIAKVSGGHESQCRRMEELTPA